MDLTGVGRYENIYCETNTCCGIYPFFRSDFDLEGTVANQSATSHERPLTSACIQQLSPLDEAQVARSGPQSMGLPKAEPGVEMIRLQTLLPVDGVVATGTVRAAYPDLTGTKQRGE